MRKKGFTLIELMVALAIIGIIASIGVIAYRDISYKIKDKICKANREDIEHAIRNQEDVKGFKVYTLDDIEAFYPDMPKCPLGGHYIWIDRIDKISCSHEIRDLYGVVHQYNEDLAGDGLSFNGHEVENVDHDERYNLSEGGTLQISLELDGYQNDWAGFIHKGNKANTDESYSLQVLNNGELAICLKTSTPNVYNGVSYNFVVLQTGSNYFNYNEKANIVATWSNEAGKKSIKLYKNGEEIENTEVYLWNFPGATHIKYNGDINELNLQLLDNEGDLLIGNQDSNANGNSGFSGDVKNINIIQGSMSEEEIQYHLSRYNP